MAAQRFSGGDRERKWNNTIMYLRVLIDGGGDSSLLCVCVVIFLFYLFIIIIFYGKTTGNPLIDGYGQSWPGSIGNAARALEPRYTFGWPTSPRRYTGIYLLLYRVMFFFGLSRSENLWEFFSRLIDFHYIPLSPVFENLTPFTRIVDETADNNRVANSPSTKSGVIG